MQRNVRDSFQLSYLTSCLHDAVWTKSLTNKNIKTASGLSQISVKCNVFSAKLHAFGHQLITPLTSISRNLLNKLNKFCCQ